MVHNAFHVDNIVLNVITQQAVQDANIHQHLFIASAMENVYLVMLTNVTIARMLIIALLVKKDIIH